jgi:hypothetical protein
VSFFLGLQAIGARDMYELQMKKRAVVSGMISNSISLKQPLHVRVIIQRINNTKVTFFILKSNRK